MATFLTRVGGFSARHRWLVILLWVVTLAGTGAAASAWSKPLDPDFTVGGLASIDTLHRIDRDFGPTSAPGGTVVFAAGAGRRITAADESTIAALRGELAAVPGVAEVSAATMSPGGSAGFLRIGLAGTDVPDGVAGAVRRARAAGLTVETSSGLTTPAAGGSAGIGLMVALLVLLVTFGSLIAAGVPLLTALLGLGIGLGGIHAATHFIDLNHVAPSLAQLLALAVGIDYALFLVDRHRRQLRDGMPVRESIALATGTAGTAVVFAALTVVAALAGLAVMRVGFLTQMGVSAALAVLVAMLITLTLTPALLSVAGPRILGRRDRGRLAAGAAARSGRIAARWFGWITRAPVLAVIAPILVLGVLAAPVTALRLGLPTDGNEPGTSTAGRAYDLMASGFGPGSNAPILVLGTPERLRGVEAVPGVASVVPTGRHGDEVLATVYPTGGPAAEGTVELVHDLRKRPGLEVTGQTAIAIDISRSLADRLPLYLALIAGLAFVLMLVVFRSVLVPLKAMLSFLLTLAASLGATVLVFQQGHLGAVLRVDPAGPLLSFLPVILIGVLFGLSMDYEMFLVTGMHERHAHGMPAREAVRAGFAQGARVVVAAALIMIAVFGGAVLEGGDATIRPLAFGLAVGVLVDAFLVRMTLVPAAMTLFGRAAWWFPRWLDRLTPRVDLEGSSPGPA